MKEFLSFAVERLGISWDMLQRYVQFIFEILENGVVMKLLWSQPKPWRWRLETLGKILRQIAPRGFAALGWTAYGRNKVKHSPVELKVHPSAFSLVTRSYVSVTTVTMVHYPVVPAWIFRSCKHFPYFRDEPKSKPQKKPATSDFSVCLVSGWWWLEHEFYDFPFSWE